MAKKAQTQTGGRALKAVFEDARRAIEDDARNALPDPDPTEERDGVKPGQWIGAPFDTWPHALTDVRVVGRSADGVVYCINGTGDLRAMEKFDMPALADLFAPRLNTLMWLWPAWGKKQVWDAELEKMVETKVVNRVERDKAMMAIINEAARRAIFDPQQQHRGRGGWQDGQGRFIWHSGGWLWGSDNGKLSRSRPAQHDGYLYTRQAATLEPWAEPVSAEESPALRILDYLRSWNWQRPYLDPLLVLGWLVTALMGGALKARPILFATGGAGVGKSTLLELLRSSLAEAALSTVNTTAAGLYQRAKHDALAFLVDELESKPGSSRGDAVIELARVAYTGGDISRGGQDHEATTFTARNSFAFFAINPPPMGAQDKSRMAIVNLARLDAPNGTGRQAMKLLPETDGRMLLRQIMDGWGDFQKTLLPRYWAALSPHGLDARAIDTFGTLLAACELVVGADAMADTGLPMDMADLGEMVGAATAVERSETLDNWHACIDHLFQSAIDQWRDGIKPTVGYVAEQLRIGPMAGGVLDIGPARERLALVGMTAVAAGKVKARPTLGACLCVPADGPALNRIFADTIWHKGVWFSALKQAPAGIVVRDLGNGQKHKINGSTKHCLLIDLDALDAFTASAEEG